MSDNRTASWTESVRVAKINLGKDPNELMEIRDELLTEAQKVYNQLVFDECLSKSGVLTKGVTHEIFCLSNIIMADSLALWFESVRVAKMNLGKDPKEFMKIQGELLAEAQKVYHLLLLANK